jgi:GTP pyrophosphokinase
LSKCCNPIPGEPVVGYLSSDDHVTIHKVKCPELERLLANQGEKIIRAEWTKFKRQSYLTRLKLEGFDRMGIVNEVTTLISKGHNINMRSVKFDTHDGIFKGDLFLYIHNADDLNQLIKRLQGIKGLDNVARIENLND